jgi:hypothetical protein
MVRKQLYLDETQDAFVRQEAARRGVTQADVVRDAIDAMRSGTRSDALESSWHELQLLWDQAAAQGGGAPYRFRRHDAYEGERGSGR